MTTPTKISSGESHDRSNENTTAMTLVPTSAPSITASAALVVTRFLPTNEATIRHVAVLDCTLLVPPRPAGGRAGRPQVLADERGDDQARRGARLHDAGDAELRHDGAEAVDEARG